MRIPQITRAMCCLMAGTVAAMVAHAPSVQAQPPGRRGVSGEVNTRPARSERHVSRLAVGKAAPDFTLPDPTGKKRVTLSSFRGKQPVVLIFGSYT